MIINMTYSDVHELRKKLNTWENEKVEKFIISMPKAGLIFQKLDIAILGIEPDEIYLKMLEDYKDNQRALQLINEDINNNIDYRK